MAVAIVAMLAALVVPSMGSDERLRLNAATAIIVSDIELAQVMTISVPKQPVVVVFNPDANAYWLAYADDPDEPIIRAGTNEPYYVVLGEGRALAATGVTLHLVDDDDDTLVFTAHGGLASLDDAPKVRVRWGDAPKYETQLSIAPTTGTINATQAVLAK